MVLPLPANNTMRLMKVLRSRVCVNQMDSPHLPSPGQKMEKWYQHLLGGQNTTVETTHSEQSTNMAHSVMCSTLTFCVCYLAMAATSTLSLSSSTILFTDAPVFNLESYTQKLYPGENVTLECSAEGNPPPEIYWEYAPAANVMVTAGGRRKNIRITGATSTNAGVYLCVAKNKVGRVTRSFTLFMKGVLIVRWHSKILM